MTTTKLYHKDLGFPNRVTNMLAGAKKAKFQFELDYSYHAKQSAETDRYGRINLPTHVDCGSAQPIEVETKDGQINKVVYRTAYNEKFDLVIVVVANDGFVRTVWLNRVDDIHNSLDESKYNKPEIH